jgi:hypothetical protein
MASHKSQPVKPPRLESRSAFCSAYEEILHTDGLRLRGIDGAADVPSEIKRARYWFKYNAFIRTVILLRLVFFNFRMEVKAEESVGAAEVKKWFQSNRRRCLRYARDAWMEWLKADNAIAVWRKGKNVINPLIVNAEDVEYSDPFGIEKIILTHGLTSETIDKMVGLTPAEKAMLKLNSRITIQHGDRLFEFEVLKRESIGRGLASPGMVSVFSAASQTESMEARDAVMSAAGRRVIEQHKIGHEIKSGLYAGRNTHFVKPADAKKVESALKGKLGFLPLVTNFDHEITYPALDTKQYDAKKYDGPLKRLSWWAMPLAQMILERALNPYLMDALKQQAEGEREWMEPHLVNVFQAMGAPRGIKITWSNRCFKDARLAADLLKYGLQWGPLSQQTFMEEAGYDTETERDRKRVEAALPKSETNPLVDANHGDKPIPGRKRGTADGQGKS